ncbi:NAD(P)-binding protein [Polyporus arcularius HHB13444]|uniref:NAD(P)-binding protein n=1 Tax=Polyporus arcularius HHB13444 TaxID=1314778 RepID=A0A5C3P860_9APHY|nr:NAD(P)-binding protein [Polyporus arcularius HHB13444]
MPALAAVRAANAAFSPAYFPVAVFVGGTSGIGRATAEAFARYTKGNAHIVIVGRNKSAADEIIASFPKPTEPAAKHEFVQCDVFLMRNIQATTAALRERLPKINFLVLSPGLLKFRGRDETAEGIDKRLGLHYYARWKFVYDLLPLVRKAKDAGEDAKVMSVLAPGHGGPVNLDDLAMKKSYNFAKAGLASPTYTDLMFEHYAKENPDLAFIHIYPGLVATPLIFASHWAFRPLNYLLKAFATTPEDCAEYMLYGLFQTEKGFSRRNQTGDDIGDYRHYGSEEERERVWEHSKEEIERALAVKIDAA